MQQLRTKSAFNNPTLKIASGIIGYGIWFMLSQSQQTQLIVEVPLCFYNQPQHLTINSPENIMISLSGKRTDLFALDRANLAIHINAAELTLGNHALEISSKTLFLPSRIKLVHYSPINALIAVNPSIKTPTQVQEQQTSV